MPGVRRRLKQFIDDVELKPDHLLIEEADVSAQARTLLSKIEKVQEELSNLEVEAFVGEQQLWDALRALLDTIRKCLSAAGRRER